MQRKKHCIFFIPFLWQVRSLDGLWDFAVSEGDALRGYREGWYALDLSKVL